MKLKSVIFMIILGLGGYFGYGTYVTHSSREVIVYKAYTKALMEGDRQRASRWALTEDALLPFQKWDQRQDHYRGKVRFTFHKVLRHEHSQRGEVVHLRVRQITRLDKEGSSSTLWGSHRVDEIHNVVLRREDGQNWRVASFNDRFVRG